MRFMNERDVEDARHRYFDHPVLGPATETLVNLVEWTNSHSDGWPYWAKPCRAAAKLQELIEGDGTWDARIHPDDRATPEALKAALRPIKAFRTRQGADFAIIES